MHTNIYIIYNTDMCYVHVYYVHVYYVHVYYVHVYYVYYVHVYYVHVYYVHSIDVTLNRGSSGFVYEFKSGLSVLKPSEVHLTLKQSKNLSNFRIKVAVSFVSSCLKC